jgi:hypothetical protein
MRAFHATQPGKASEGQKDRQQYQGCENNAAEDLTSGRYLKRQCLWPKKKSAGANDPEWSEVLH